MGGGKSSSSSANTQTTTTSTATGVVGDAFQGQTINVTDELPDNAVEVFNTLASLGKDAFDFARSAGSAAVDITQRSIEQSERATQPDLTALETVQETSQKQLRYLIMGAVAIAGVALIVIIGRKK